MFQSALLSEKTLGDACGTQVVKLWQKIQERIRVLLGKIILWSMNSPGRS
jgi:hypothetical protein